MHKRASLVILAFFSLSLMTNVVADVALAETAAPASSIVPGTIRAYPTTVRYSICHS